MAAHSPAMEPPTTNNSATHKTFTPARCHFGSTPPINGAAYNPAASHAVAIQVIANCVCQVRVIAYGNHSDSGMP